MPLAFPWVFSVVSQTTMKVIRGLVNGRSNQVAWRPMTFVSMPVPEISFPISSGSRYVESTYSDVW